MPRDHVQVRLESSDVSCAGMEIATLEGREAISELFCFELSIVIPEPGSLDTEAALGAEVSIVFELDGAELRRVHGIISSADDLLDADPAFRTYRLRISPRAFRLTLVQFQDVLLDLSVPEIIDQKLSMVGLGADDVEWNLIGSYPKREFVIQYQETDLALVCRLAEHLGISFYFEHREDRDVMIFTDHPSGFHPIVREAPVSFHARGERTEVFRLASCKSPMPALWAVQDYNYRTPQVDLTGNHEAPFGMAGGVIEYGVHQKSPDEGKALARIRAEERAARCRFFEGEADVCQFAAGATFELLDHPRLSAEPSFLLVEVKHAIAQVVLGDSGAKAKPYTNTFRAIDAKSTFRPMRITPRPRINGVLTALIEPRGDGKVGKMAELDEQGRYTIRFLFDNTAFGEKPKSSHRVRMIQHHVGPNYGTHLPLKAGIEVLVVFVNGDPDRPLIVGAVPNPITPSPVNMSDPLVHRIKTASGVYMEMKDHF